jgi:hypothetical protein
MRSVDAVCGMMSFEGTSPGCSLPRSYYGFLDRLLCGWALANGRADRDPAVSPLLPTPSWRRPSLLAVTSAIYRTSLQLLGKQWLGGRNAMHAGRSQYTERRADSYILTRLNSGFRNRSPGATVAKDLCRIPCRCFFQRSCASLAISLCLIHCRFPREARTNLPRLSLRLLAVTYQTFIAPRPGHISQLFCSFADAQSTVGTTISLRSNECRYWSHYGSVNMTTVARSCGRSMNDRAGNSLTS